MIRHHCQTNRLPRLIASGLVAGGLLLTVTGCYERVVRQDKGVGVRQRSRTYESNLESSRVPVLDDFLDFALDEDTKPKSKSTGSPRK